MHSFTLLPPQIAGHEATFRWRVEPAADLFRENQFTLKFPLSVDLARIPDGLWWTIGLTALHSTWMLLQPCRVYLPVTLRPGEAETWQRLIQSQFATLQANRGSHDFTCDVTIIEEGPSISYQVVPPSDRCATAFSSGKDSLTHAGLLTELTKDPILVTTTSEMTGLKDHSAPRRRYVLGEIARRLPATLIEVESDYRGNLDHGYAMKLGYEISVNEVTDTFLYTAALIASAVSLGATHLFLAAEAEADENLSINGQVIQHMHCMCSSPSLVALQEILKPFGLSYGSLIPPLRRYHAQTLLWSRYPSISDLQYSCWLLKEDEYGCNRCIKCFVLAMREYAMGVDTKKMKVKWVTMLNEYRDWTPRMDLHDGKPLLPRDTHWVTTDAQIARDLAAIPWSRMARTIRNDEPLSLLRYSGWRALIAYAQLRRRAIASNPGPVPGYREGYLHFVDPLLREEVGRIYAEHFAPQPESEYQEMLERSQMLADWIIESLGGLRAKGNEENHGTYGKKTERYGKEK
jgi:hypothetical protein